VLQEQLDTFNVAALAADNISRYVAANVKASEVTGYTRAELLDMVVSDLTPPMRHDSAGELWNRFIQSGTQTGEFVLVRKDGSRLGVHYAAYASVAPGVHLALLTPLEVPSSI